MGNKCSSCMMCCGSSDGLRCCLGSTPASKRSKKSGGMVAADLHSSGADMQRKDKKQGQQRPDTLPIQSPRAIAPSTSASGDQNQSLPLKFSEFSLHGVQKTSPVGHSDSVVDDIEEKSEHHTFLLENVSLFFDCYKDQDSDDYILAEGVARFCNDLDVDPAAFIVLVLAWKFKAATMCKFSRDEFTNGCVALQADSVKSLKGAFPVLEHEATTNFKDLYKFTFQFGLDSEEGQRSLPCDIAIAMWRIVFSKNKPPLLDAWIKFLEETKTRGISRDTWNMFLHFTENVGTDLNNYDDNEAWPSLFDDFVEYYREEQLKEEMGKGEADRVFVETGAFDDADSVTPGGSKPSLNEQLPKTSGEECVVETSPVHVISDGKEVQYLGETEPDASRTQNKIENHDTLNNEMAASAHSLLETSVEVNIPGTILGNISNEKLNNNDYHFVETENQGIASGEPDKDREVEELSRSSMPELIVTEDRHVETDTDPIRSDTLHSSHS